MASQFNRPSSVPTSKPAAPARNPAAPAPVKSDVRNSAVPKPAPAPAKKIVTQEQIARRAYEIGLVSEITPKEQLHERTEWAANAIASQPPLAIEGTVRAIWGARELGQRQALRLGYAYVGLGTNQDSIAEGQKLFESGTRIDWRSR